MLRQLSIENLGLIEQASLDLGRGLQVITGETGVGKSMLLGAFAAIRGERARTDAIRTGAESARVSGFFVIESAETRHALEEILGHPLEDGELLIERHLHRRGRHRARSNGRDIPLAILRRIGEVLFEIEGQRGQMALLSPKAQCEQLDRFGGLVDASREFAREFRDLRALADRVDRIQRSCRERNDKKLFLQHVVEDLENAQLVENERESLSSELGLLEGREKLMAQISEILESFYDGDNSVLDRIAAGEQALGHRAGQDPRISEFLGSFETARVALEDGVGAVASRVVNPDAVVYLDDFGTRRGRAGSAGEDFG